MPSKRNYCPCLEQFFVKFLSRAHFPGLFVQTSGNEYSSGNTDTALTTEKWWYLNSVLLNSPLHHPAGYSRQYSLHGLIINSFTMWAMSAHQSLPYLHSKIMKRLAQVLLEKGKFPEKGNVAALYWDCFSVSHLCIGCCSEFLWKGQEASLFFP